MNKVKAENLFLILTGCVILLILTNLGLFLRMNQLQSQVVQSLRPFQRPTGLEVGTAAPLFSLANIDGRLVSLQDYSGQRVLVVFSATTCPVCQEAYPILKRFSERNPEIALLMISRGSVDDNRRVLQEAGLTFPILTWQDEIAGKYQVPGTPWFYVIDEQGIVANQGAASSLEQLEELTATGRK